MIQIPIRRALLAVPAIADAFARYDFGNGGEPALFTTDTVPEDCPNPAATITIDGGGDFGATGLFGAQVDYTVRLFDDKARNQDRIFKLGTDIWSVLHRGDLTPYMRNSPAAGYADWVLSCLFPQNAGRDPQGFPMVILKGLASIATER